MELDNNKYRSYREILESDPEELYNWIQERFIEEIPTSLETPDELILAGNRLGELTNIYSYLMSLVSIVNVYVKESKRKKIDKEVIDSFMEIREILQNSSDIIKMQYTAISRMITVKKQANDEINMV